MSAIEGYGLVLPPGWSRVPLGGNHESALRRLSDLAFADSRDVIHDSVVREFRRRMRAQMASARAVGGLDLYLPLRQLHGVPVLASFVVSQVAFDRNPDISGLRSLQDAGVTAAEVSLDSSPGIRREYRAAGAASMKVDAATVDAEIPTARHVEYIVSVPGEARRYIVVAFSVLVVEEPQVWEAIIIDLFDAIMTTFRWRRTEGGK